MFKLNAKRYNFLSDSGELPISVADGSFETQKIDVDYSLYEVYIEFFSDADLKTPVTPTAGTISVSASPLGNNYIEASENSIISASEVQAGESSYLPAVIDGLISRARITFSGVTGAPYARAVLYGHD